MEDALNEVSCWSNDDCRSDEMYLKCGWIETNTDWSSDFCMPGEMCGQEVEMEGEWAGIYCYEDRYEGALKTTLSVLSIAAALYASI